MNQLVPKTIGNNLATPDYLTGAESTGLEDLGASDFKIPRLLLLQALSPAVTRDHPGAAIPGHFWHTGLSTDLGNKVNMVPLIARKRVILWRPQEDNGGGILAFSADGKNWLNGANQEFSVRLKGVKNPVVWSTKGNVAQSNLLNWGTSNPEDPESAPAATLSYEYLCYLTDHPELSPVVLSCNKTALPRAKQFNTALLVMANSRKPSYCLNVELTVGQERDGNNSWFVPNFRVAGTITKEVFDITSELNKKHQTYVSDPEQEKAAADISGETAF